MKHKRILSHTAALLAFLILLPGLSSCLHIQKVDGGSPDPDIGTPVPVVPDTDPPETDAPETDPPETLPPEPDPVEVAANFTLEELTAQNGIPALLSRHESVTIRREYDGGSQTQSLWTRDGDRVCYDVSEASSDGESWQSVGGSYRGFDFMVGDEGQVYSSLWVCAEQMVFDGWIDALITDYLPVETAGEIRILGEDAETFTALLPENLVLDDGSAVSCDNTVVLDKGTLDIRSFRWEYVLDDVLHTGEFTVEYDGEKLGEELMADWDETMKLYVNVTTEAGERTETYDYPTRWQLRLLPDEGILLTSADAVVEEQSVLIEPTVQTVTVFAFDEANYPETEPDPVENGELPFTLETLAENNRITNLLNQYGTVVLANEAEYGSYNTSYFRFGDSIVRYTGYSWTDEDGTEYKGGHGNLGEDYFEADPERGGYVYSASVPDSGEYLFTDQNADGEHYLYDRTLTDALMMGSVTDVKKVGDNVSFRYVYEFDETGEEALTYTVEPVNVLIRSIDLESYGNSEKVLLGEDVPFEEELKKAFEKTRTILCHYGEAGDRSYTLPADWSFRPGYMEVLLFYTDAAMKELCEGPIPGDGKDYELWVREREESFSANEPTEPDSLDRYAGTWYSGTSPCVLTVEENGRFSFESGGEVYEGTLAWTEESKSLSASGPRCELMLDNGTVLSGDAFVSEFGGRITLAQNGGAEIYRKDSFVRAVHEADAGRIPEDCLTFDADTGPYAAKVLLTPEFPVRNFVFFSLKLEDSGADEGPVYSAAELYRLADFSWEKPLLVSVSFGEIYPLYGFSYTDQNGGVRSFGLVESGMDGSVQVIDIRVAFG